MSNWLTTCRKVHNDLPFDIVWADWEWIGGLNPPAAGIKAGASEDAYQVDFPWCSDSLEVKKKAFRVYRDIWPKDPCPPFVAFSDGVWKWVRANLPDQLAPIMYVFQNYRDDTVYYSLVDAAGDPTAWKDKQSCGEGPSGALELHYTENPSLSAWAKAVP